MPWPTADEAVFDLIRREVHRQNTTIQLIASENFASPAVMAATGSVFTNKYSEGYPGRRYYGGNVVVDEVEDLARQRACELFGGDHANVQPHAGAIANMGAYQALIGAGDTVLGMSLDHGGHLTHGSPVNFSGLQYRFVSYGVTASDERIDLDQLRDLALAERPKLIVAGATAYPRLIQPEPLREIADESGAMLMFDAAHIAGLIAGGVHPNPTQFADVVTFTTHKTLRGPPGRRHRLPVRLREGDRQGHVPRHPGRPPRPRGGGQGGGLRRGGHARVRRLRGPDRGELQGSGLRAGRPRVPTGVGRHRQPPDAGGPAHLRSRPDRQGGPGHPRRRRDQPEQEHRARRPPLAVRHLRRTHRHAAVTTQGMDTDDMATIADLISRALRNRLDDSAVAAVRADAKELCSAKPPYPGLDTED